MDRYNKGAIKELLDKSGILESEFLEEIQEYCYKVTRPQIKGLISGLRKPNSVYLHAISKVFDVPFSYFFREETKEDIERYHAKAKKKKRNGDELVGLKKYIENIKGEQNV